MTNYTLIYLKQSFSLLILIDYDHLLYYNPVITWPPSSCTTFSFFNNTLPAPPPPPPQMPMLMPMPLLPPIIYRCSTTNTPPCTIFPTPTTQIQPQIFTARIHCSKYYFLQSPHHHTRMKYCIRCNAAHVKCHILSGAKHCTRCLKYHFQCVFTSSSSQPPSPSPSPPPLVPTWTHRYRAQTTSSGRVKAAAIAFLASNPNDHIVSLRLADKILKKAAKQDKFLQVVLAFPCSNDLLNEADIRNGIVVFDGSISHPPPPILSPPNVSNIN